jgi:isoleucyl-tRNA synthetase
MVISTIVKGCAPFQNLIVNGIVLAENGEKMSKSKKNYPDPTGIANEHGADAVRLYLCNSPAVRAEDLKFAGTGVKDIVKDIFLPWYNAYRFMIQNITRFEKRTGKNFVYDPKLKFAISSNKDANYMDKWIVAANQRLIKLVRGEFDNYRLYTVVREILEFLENLTNWYVRLNRPRMRGEEGVEVDDQYASLNTLFDVLLNSTQLMAPVTPFLSEYFFQNLRNGLAEDSPLYVDSIHFTSIPEYAEELLDDQIEQTVKRMQNAIETGRLVRDRVKIPMKYPLRKVKLVDADLSVLEGFGTIEKYIKEELNCYEMETARDEDNFVLYSCKPDHRALGQLLKKDYNKQFKADLTKLTNEQLKAYLKNGSIEVNGKAIGEGMLNVEKCFNPTYQKHKEWACHASMESSVMLYKLLDDELMEVGLAKEATSKIQRLRKSSGISIDD